ncbi:Ig-like domain-containing protein [Cohnella cellulosilytica]|uniref:Ig-like domain-containing protein n=1 Tax=Cohnella cellulosilytica TaxID=986710 RepID=A0ABW2FLZ9_9BACL
MGTIEEWIKETHPQPNAVGVPEDTLIAISFRQDINRNTLNTRNILVLDGNHGGRLISSRFLYRYESDKRRLLIYLKEEAERLGAGNTIEIILTGRIANVRNSRMEIPYHLRFTTK